jgi:hypothetical protein
MKGILKERRHIIIKIKERAMLKLILLKIFFLVLSAVFICLAFFIYLCFAVTRYADSSTIYPYLYLALIGLSLVVAGYFFIAFLKVKIDKTGTSRLNF